MAAIAVPRTRWLPRALFTATAATAALIALALIAGVVFHETDRDGGIRRSAITETPQLVNVAGYAAVVVRQRGVSYAFVPVVASSDPLTYCEGQRTQGIFMSRDGGSQFALDGRKLGGPAPRSLDRYDTTIRGDELIVHVHHTTRSAGPGPDVPLVRWNAHRTLAPFYCPPGDVVDRLGSR